MGSGDGVSKGRPNSNTNVNIFVKMLEMFYFSHHVIMCNLKLTHRSISFIKDHHKSHRNSRLDKTMLSYHPQGTFVDCSPGIIIFVIT